ncbi:hypothetical protein [Salininema proteolyticum]|uniref:DUF3267 domain-containing protein n=1 Tax=Salininema proteolyticum TaxID=1607685 RepID=A0ABV8U4I6_9ACTN
MSKASTLPRSEASVVRTALAVVFQVWPVLVFLALILGAALAWAAATGDTSQLPLAWGIALTGFIGLAGSFALHEATHTAVLKRVPTVSAITLARTMLRVSVVPHGYMTGRQAALAAVAGPGACVVVGAVLAASPSTRYLSWWFLGHGVFLLPVFGDGMALLKGLLSWRRPIDLGQPG